MKEGSLLAVFCFKCLLYMDWNLLFLILRNFCFHSFENDFFAAKSGSEHSVSREVTEGRKIVCVQNPLTFTYLVLDFPAEELECLDLA